MWLVARRQNQIEGQINLRDAIKRSISFTDPKSGKAYALKSKVATLMVRPRGWHLPEKHIRVDDRSVRLVGSGSWSQAAAASPEHASCALLATGC